MPDISKLLKSLNSFWFEIDQQGTIINLSDRLPTIIGMDPLEDEMTVFDLLNQKQSGYLKTKISQALNSPNQAIDVELVIVRNASGKVHLRGHIIGAFGGVIDQTLILLENVTPQPSEDLRFHEVIGGSPDAIIIHRKNRFLFANKAAAELIEADQQALLNDHKVSDFVHPDDFAQIVKSREADKGILHLPEGYDFRLQCGSGVEKTAFSRGTRIMWNGEPALLATLDDVTQVRAAELSTALADMVNDGLESACFVVEPNGKLAFANSKAEMFLAQGNVFSLDHRNRLVSVSLSNSKILHQMIKEVIKDNPHNEPSVSRFLRIPPNNGHDAVAAMIAPLALSSQRLFPGFSGMNSNKVMAIIFLSSGPVDQAPCTDLFRTQFGLTKAEARVLCTLMTGASIEDYCANRGVSINTARSQLQATFQKTGTARQAELISLAHHITKGFPLAESKRD
jgi:PAS domain S-box-containing protein